LLIVDVLIYRICMYQSNTREARSERAYM
jgi:hypothetical protein